MASPRYEIQSAEVQSRQTRFRSGAHCDMAFETWNRRCTDYFSQELYEPLWEEIYSRSKQNGMRIRSIWMADVAQEGQSSVINEDSLGNDRT